MKGNPDHDDPVVVGAGERRGDRHEAQRGALDRSGQVHLPVGVERVGAGSGSDVRSPDLAWRGQLGAACSARPGCSAAAAIARLRAVGDPSQVAGESRRHPEVEVAEELVPVVAVKLEVKELKSRRPDLIVPATSRGRKGRVWPGQGLPPGPESALKCGRESCREAHVPGREASQRPHRGCSCVGVATKPRSDANRCRSNSSKGTWGRSVEVASSAVPSEGRGGSRRPAWRACRSHRRS